MNFGVKEWRKLIDNWVYRNFIIDLGRFSTLLLATYLVFEGKISIGSMVLNTFSSNPFIKLNLSVSS